MPLHHFHLTSRYKLIKNMKFIQKSHEIMAPNFTSRSAVYEIYEPLDCTITRIKNTVF